MKTQTEQEAPTNETGDLIITVRGLPDWLELDISTIEKILQLLGVTKFVIQGNSNHRNDNSMAELLQDYSEGDELITSALNRSQKPSSYEVQIFLRALGFKQNGQSYTAEEKAELVEQLNNAIGAMLMKMANEYLYMLNDLFPHLAVEALSFSFEVAYLVLLFLTTINAIVELTTGWPANDLIAKIDLVDVANDYWKYLLIVWLVSNLPKLVEIVSSKLSRNTIPAQPFYRPRLLPNVPLDRYLQAVWLIMRSSYASVKQDEEVAEVKKMI